MITFKRFQLSITMMTNWFPKEIKNYLFSFFLVVVAVLVLVVSVFIFFFNLAYPFGYRKFPFLRSFAIITRESDCLLKS